MAKLDEEWNELIDKLPDDIIKPIQDKDISKKVKETYNKQLLTIRPYYFLCYFFSGDATVHRLLFYVSVRLRLIHLQF